MKPSHISALGFKFYGGNTEDCLFALYPQSLKETSSMILEARAFMEDTGSKWAEMIMCSKDGGKEIVKLYASQEVNTTSAPAANSMIVKNTVADRSNITDPYSFSNGK